MQALVVQLKILSPTLFDDPEFFSTLSLVPLPSGFLSSPPSLNFCPLFLWISVPVSLDASPPRAGGAALQAQCAPPTRWGRGSRVAVCLATCGVTRKLPLGWLGALRRQGRFHALRGVLGKG